MATATEIQDRVINALAEILTGDRISSDDLRQFNVVRYAFRPQLDANISRLVDPEFGRPELARGLLVGLLIHTLERLLSPQPGAPLKSGSLARRVRCRPQRSFTANNRDTVKPASHQTTKRVSRSARKYRAMISAMSPEELEAFRIKERERQKAMRARKTGTL